MEIKDGNKHRPTLSSCRLPRCVKLTSRSLVKVKRSTPRYSGLANILKVTLVVQAGSPWILDAKSHDAHCACSRITVHPSKASGLSQPAHEIIVRLLHTAIMKSAQCIPKAMRDIFPTASRSKLCCPSAINHTHVQKSIAFSHT